MAYAFGAAVEIRQLYIRRDGEACDCNGRKTKHGRILDETLPTISSTNGFTYFDVSSSQDAPCNMSGEMAASQRTYSVAAWDIDLRQVVTLSYPEDQLQPAVEGVLFVDTVNLDAPSADVAELLRIKALIGQL